MGASPIDFVAYSTNISLQLTIMVKTINASLYTGAIPGQEENRKISGGPLYDAELVLGILSAATKQLVPVVPWTRKCITDLQRYELDGTDLVELLILTLSQGAYKSSEWCESKPGGPWAACDAYKVSRSEYLSAQDRSYQVEYYIKFAVSRQGTLLLLVSCHY
jgi:hypothetical protein